MARWGQVSCSAVRSSAGDLPERRAPMNIPRRGILHYGHVTLNTDRRTLRFNGEELALSPLEARLLAVLMERAPRVSPPELLLTLLWPDGEGNWTLLTELLAALRLKLQENEVGCGLAYIAPFGHRLELIRRDRNGEQDDTLT